MKYRIYKHAVVLSTVFVLLQTAPLVGMLSLKNMSLGVAGMTLGAFTQGGSLVQPFTKDIFIGKTAVVGSPIQPLRIGIVDAKRPGVADAISGLLVRAISDARESNKIPGHLPDHLVDYVIENYVSPNKVTSLWADYGQRFAMLTMGGEIVGTVHVATSPDTILYYNRSTNNVSSCLFPGFKPAGYHQIMNLTVKHELRRFGLASLLLTTISKNFRDMFPGYGLWMRADPPWHDKLTGIGFRHDPSMDSYLDEDVEKTCGMSHADYNKKYLCTCVHSNPGRPDRLLVRAHCLAKKKLQYVSCTYDFDLKKNVITAPNPLCPTPDDLALSCAASILKFYQYKLDSAPDGFAFVWSKVLDVFKHTYCNDASRKSLSVYFSDLKKIIESQQSLSVCKRAALNWAVKSSRNDIQLEDVPVTQDEPATLLDQPLGSDTATGFSATVLDKFDINSVMWSNNEEYVVDRVGPVHQIIDQFTAEDEIIVSNLGIASYRTNYTKKVSPDTILHLQRINLPISSYEKEIWLITYKNQKRTLFFGNLKGNNYSLHYGLLLKKYLQLTKNSARLTPWISLTKELPEYTSLKMFVTSNRAALKNSTVLVFGYAPVCRSRWSKYYQETIGSDNGSWKADIYGLPGGHSVAVLATRLPMHGEILAENFDRALFELPNVKYLFVGGTAGSLNAKVPYQMVFPQCIRVPLNKQSVANVLSPKTISHVIVESHMSVLSPLIETPGYLAQLKGTGVTTVDMEVGYIADIAQKHPGLHIGVGFIITDFPVYPFVTACTLFTKDMQKHSQARVAFPEAIYQFLVNGKTVSPSQLERRFGSLNTISHANIVHEKVLLGKLSPAEQLLKKRLVEELPLGFFIRASKTRLWQALNHKVFLASMLAGDFLAKPAKTNTPPLEDQIFGAYNYIYGIVGTRNDIDSYGDVIIKVKESAWSKNSWASKYSGWWAAQRLEKQRGISIISGKKGRETITNGAYLTLVQDQFKRWIFAPEDYKEAIALLTISHLRHKPAELFKKFLSVSIQELPLLMRANNFGKLEGKIPCGLDLQDIEKVLLPLDTSLEMQNLLKINKIPFEFIGKIS